MPTPSQLDLTAAQINTALNNAWDSDQQPALGQANLCNGDKIAAAISSAVGAVSSDVATLDGQVTALGGRVTALEGNGLVATFTKASGSVNSTTVLITTYTETDADGIASESAGTITVTGSGVYLLFFNGKYTKDPDGGYYFDIQYRVNGSVVFSTVSLPQAATYLTHSFPVTSTGSFTVDIRVVKYSTLHLTYSNVSISIVKLA